MKKLLIIPILLLIIISCSKSDNNDVLDYTNNHPELLGKWQIVDFLSDIPPNPFPIVNGFTITFNVDGTFSSNQFVDFPNGNYTVSTSNVISLNYISSNNVIDTKYKDIWSINNTTLILKLDENDSEKYEKISNQ